MFDAFILTFFVISAILYLLYNNSKAAVGPTYGYEIIGKLEKHPIGAVKANTIYPLLGRLSKEGYISSAEQEQNGKSPERKYYSVTAKGLEYIASMSDEWDNLLNAIEEITGRRNAKNEHCYIQPIGRTDL